MLVSRHLDKRILQSLALKTFLIQNSTEIHEMSGMKLIIREGLLAERRLPWLLGCLQLLELQMAVGRFGFQPHFRA